MMVALNTTRDAANKLAGTPIPNLPSYLGCIIARLVGLRRSLVSRNTIPATRRVVRTLAVDGSGMTVVLWRSRYSSGQ